MQSVPSQYAVWIVGKAAIFQLQTNHITQCVLTELCLKAKSRSTVTEELTKFDIILKMTLYNFLSQECNKNRPNE